MIKQISTPPLRETTPIPSKGSAFRDWVAPLASLRFTVALLALTMILVFAGTSAQKEAGIWEVQHRYFHSFFAWVDFRLLFPLWSWGFANIPGRFPMPGGYTLIALLLANLLAAHSIRFKFNRKRVGILLIHAGLIVLIVGEVITSLYQVEGRMTIEEGETVSFTEDSRSAELAIVDSSMPDKDRVVVIPATKLKRGATINWPTLPFSIHVERFYANSTIVGQNEQAKPEIKATAGIGARMPSSIVEAPPATGVQAGEVDWPSAFITLAAPNQSLGTFAVSPMIRTPQPVEVDGHTYDIRLRWKREYRPYSLTLKEFRFDRYTGTNTPRNFSSLVQLVDPSRNENREVKIWMNHPLRYAGETFFQADWNRQTERGTVLQVVRNPGWLIPYISCTLVAFGLLVHFGTKLLDFLRRVAGVDLKGRSGGIAIPTAVVAISFLLLLASGRPPKQEVGSFDLNAFGRVPISYEGRVMPLDSLARFSLRILSGKSDLKLDDGKSLRAIEWLADMFGQPERAASYKVFRIDHPDVIDVMGLNPDRKLFSLEELAPAAEKFGAQVKQIEGLPTKALTLYQAKLRELDNHVGLYMRLAMRGSLYLAPPASSDQHDWITLADAEAKSASHLNPGYLAFMRMTHAYGHGDIDTFNSVIDGYLGWTASNLPDVAKKTMVETAFNYFDPFVRSIYFYVLAFVLVLASWLITPVRLTLQRTAMWLLMLIFSFHTLGLIARIYIQERPPVTNLYSSAIFIGWGAVLFCLVLENIFRNGLGSLAASAIAFPTLIIAHYLAADGDTMQMLQAVLDTNIWLATHVVVVTLGYMATFLAGVFALVYVIAAFFGAFDDDDLRRIMNRIVYGVLCFALLFSFVGTVLGGIWADQSWGRFWGWDPKENGAVLIVLWNAIVLHARWAGIVKTRGMMCMAIFGNIVTAWSWFGTNMMGIGLHSYGFMDGAVRVLAVFVMSQIALIGIGLLPAPLASRTYQRPE